MDLVTASKERLEFAKVCVDVEASVSIPQTIDIIVMDGSFITIRVIIPWLPSSGGHCKFLQDNTATLLNQLGKNVLETILQSIEEPQANVETSVIDLKYKTPIDGTVSSEHNSGSKDSFILPATISQQKKSTSTEKPKKMIFGSTAKFHQIITGADDTRKPRAASMGVAAFLQDIKTNKKDPTTKKSKILVVVDRGTNSKSTQ
ncbi:hypothetical protein V6N13_064066 [Hibiscus sabdariffa]